MLAKIHDIEISKDNMYAELQKTRAVNTDLDLKIQENEKLITDMDPTIVRQQKELILDLK